MSGREILQSTRSTLDLMRLLATVPVRAADQEETAPLLAELFLYPKGLPRFFEGDVRSNLRQYQARDVNPSYRALVATPYGGRRYLVTPENIFGDEEQYLRNIPPDLQDLFTKALLWQRPSRPYEVVISARVWNDMTWFEDFLEMVQSWEAGDYVLRSGRVVVDVRAGGEVHPLQVTLDESRDEGLVFLLNPGTRRRPEYEKRVAAARGF